MDTKKIGIGNLTEDDLIAAWYFEEDNGNVVKDYKGNYNGTANGTVVIDTTYGKGRSFDGVDDYIQFENAVIPMGKKSIRFKVKTSFSTPDKQAVILSNSGGYSVEKGIHVSMKDGQIDVLLGKGVNGDYSGTITSNKSINDGQWHDILVTCDDTNNINLLKLYIDDMEVPDVMGTSRVVDGGPSFNMTIGRRCEEKVIHGVYYDYFEGELSDIEIYNKVYIPSVSTNNALLRITMINGIINEYDLSMEEVDSFINWYEGRSKGTGEPYYTFSKNYNVGPFMNRKDYLTFDKISQFEVMEYKD